MTRKEFDQQAEEMKREAAHLKKDKPFMWETGLRILRMRYRDLLRTFRKSGVPKEENFEEMVISALG